MPKPTRAFLTLCDELTKKAFDKKPPTPITRDERLSIHQDRIYLWGVSQGHYPDLKGVQFKTDRHDCIWTVLYYHRSQNWVCQEPKHKTTCNFHTKEIEAGKINL